MPLRDYQCSTCGALLQDQYAPLLSTEPPPCPAGCVSSSRTTTMETLWSAGSSSAPFKEIQIEVGRGASARTITLTSLGQLRRLESDSIRDWEAGVPGAQPLLFKNFSDDHSNRDRSLFERHFGDRIRRPAEIDPRRTHSGVSGRRKISVGVARVDPRELD